MTKFLLAHPDSTTLKALQQALRDLHYDVGVTLEGLDAIDRTLDEKPDALVLGFDLHGLSGLDAARALRAIEPTKDIPILFVAENSEQAAFVARAGLPNVEITVGTKDLEHFREEAQRLLLLKNRPDMIVYEEEDLQAISDPITGLYARHYMLHRLAYEAARSARYKNPVSCLLFGIIGLEDLMERDGTASANQLLVEVGRVLERSVRSTDILGRADKAEFLLVAPQTDERGAHRSATRLRQVAVDHTYTLRPPFDHIDIAVGVASAFGGSVSENLALLARAEGALSEARENKDRVLVG